MTVAVGGPYTYRNVIHTDMNVAFVSESIYRKRACAG